MKGISVMKSLIINKKDLAHNIDVLKRISRMQIIRPETDYKIIGVVKGNGYGLGLVEYSKFLIDHGIEILAVANIEELITLRNAGITTDILMLTPTPIKEELEILIGNNAIITISSRKDAEVANEIAKEGKTIRTHIAIDTGFGRYGFLYNDDNLKNVLQNLDPNIKIEGLFSHFSFAYYENNCWTKKQFNRFIDVLQIFRSLNIDLKMVHICNSAAYLNYYNMHLNAARIGSAILGRVDNNKIGLKKIGQIKSQVTEIKILPKGYNVGYLNIFKTKKETKIAIIPVGYMDGFYAGTKNDMFRFRDKLRNIKEIIKKNKIEIEINGKKYPIIGKIGMYHITVDITGSDIKEGDYVYLNVNIMHVDSNLRREFV